ncbi:MAG: hypothetical protein KatS3mg103_0556 [Phycisphaerales bacterium]|nr:MAG: hypothetical protein KatS3mg103_0556 [Phycisphaerales bacterium]
MAPLRTSRRPWLTSPEHATLDDPRTNLPSMPAFAFLPSSTRALGLGRGGRRPGLGVVATGCGGGPVAMAGPALASGRACVGLGVHGATSILS